MVIFRDVYTQVIYNYIELHDGDLILYKDIMSKFQMSYPTIRKKINWLIKNNFIEKQGRKISIIPEWRR